MGIDVRDPDQPVGTLSGGERQAVAIARAVYFGAKVLILDEPTSALGVKQSGVVLRYVAQARERGLGVIFITHNPHHAFPVGDRFVVLNRGTAARLLEQGRDHPRRADQDDVGRRGARRADPRDRARPRVGGGRDAALPTRRRRPAATGAARRRIGIGLIGFGWLGQAHSRSMLRIPTLFAERSFDPELVVCSDTVPARIDEAVGSFGFARGGDRLARGHRRPRGRRRLHRPRRTCCTSSSSRRPRRPASTCSARSRSAARPSRPSAPSGPRAHAGVTTGVGYNYRWAPLVRYARAADRRRAPGRDHQLPRALLLDVRQRPARAAVVALPRRRGRPRGDQRPAQPRGRPRAHAARADHARGRARRRPSSPSARCAAAGPGPLRPRRARRPARRGHQRGLRRACCASSPRARAGPSRPAARSSAPRARTRSTSTAPRARWAGTSSSSTSCALYLAEDELAHRLPRPCSAATASPTTAPSCRAARTASASRTSSPSRTTSSAARSPRAGPFTPGFAEAVDWVCVQAALLRSAQSGRWEDVVSLRED